ncbi:Fic family protein [Candidatus Woesearchaeota archaeon]|nr:Fic family protein [Candidatus Woesearchaeota archaeon]
MNEKDFTSERAGKAVWEPQGAYFRFEPRFLPLEFEEQKALSFQAQKTSLALGRLDGLTKKFSEQEISLFMLPFMIKEAQLSSEIEGTRSTISDVFKGEKIKEQNLEKRLDNEEIRNYQEALLQALKTNETKFSEELIKEIHKKLLQGVRGEDKEPGNYKEKQNAIGKREDTFDSAKFVPASPETTHHLMKNLIEYMNSDEDVIPLYKIALTHYQFEAIHPFRDGNGRIGRMFIVLQLCKEKIISQPLLYISEYLTRNKDRYIEALYEVSAKGKIEDWLIFILKALEVQAEKSFELLNKIDTYKQELHQKIQGFSQSPKMHAIIDSLFKQPFFTVEDIRVILESTQPTAWNLVQKLIEANIAEEVGSEGRKKVYVAGKIIDLLEGKI